MNTISGRIIAPKRDFRHNAKKIFISSLSILRGEKLLATPRVAASQHKIACDEWNQASDELKGKLTIYPLAFENDSATIGSG
jgi:hypothetical protein